MGWDIAGVSVRARAWFVFSSRELAGRLRQYQTTALPARAHFALRTGRGEPLLLPDGAHAGPGGGAYARLVGFYHRCDCDADLLRHHGALSEHTLFVRLASIEPDYRRGFNACGGGKMKTVALV